jgi:hypothetical protein
MTLADLKAAIQRAEKAGLPLTASVCFDTEARSFFVHLIEIDDAGPLFKEDSPDDEDRLILTTRYH